ncbi:MAG: dTDP-4-dehydrorhamnose reductase [Deltaproteobacteria bacterium]|nr:dTDP-4-dehydrorhamnose reductase [Deltaproteobacteria bacterium]
MRIIVIGSKGQLGWELCRRGKQHGFNIIARDLPIFDITDRNAIRKTITESNASLVINASAYTAVDKAESEAETAFAVNRDGPACLALSCAENRLPLIHISTDYVFDGRKQYPYLESDPVSPLGVYGNSKASGEEEVRETLTEHIILRTSWLYGVHGSNFLKTMLRVGKENETLRVVDDQHGCPTYAADLAEAILSIANHLGKKGVEPWGTYHFCGKGKTTWHGFTEKIVELARPHISLKVKRIEPVTTAEYPTPARRPANSVLDCSSLANIFNITPLPWENSLSRAISALLTKGTI